MKKPIRPAKPSRGRANFEFLDAMTEEDIERTSPPELANLPDDFWDSAVPMPPVEKMPISIRIDFDVLHWFRVGGPGYQSRINAVLRDFMNRAPAAAAKKKRKA